MTGGVKSALYAIAVFGFVTAAGLPLQAAEPSAIGIWRGTLTLDNARDKEPHIETKAALHLRGAGEASELFVDRLGRALPVGEVFRNPNGTTDIYAGAAPSIELRGIRFAKDRFDSAAIHENEARALWSGKASFARVKLLSAPSGKPKCDGAPASLGALCGAWSGISLRGQPKLLIVDSVTRNKQKIAWELKAKQVWGGESDLASAGMSFPYTIYITDEELPLAALFLRTTGRIAYRFDIGGDTLTGGSISDAADKTVYVRAGR